MDIERICKVLESGGLVISPTDTIYGIMGDALKEDVIKRVYKAKKRPYSKPLILLMDSYEMIKEYTLEINGLEDKVIKETLPGLVTIILKKNDKISNLITDGKDFVGIRIPDNEKLRLIIKKLGRPVISTSANISDEDVITSIDEISDDLLRYIDYVEDGGKIVACSSTIVKVENNEIKILRAGEMAETLKSIV